MLCFVIALEFQSISISLSLCLTLTLSLPLSLYSFCSGHNIDYDSRIFLGFALFGCCVLLLFIAFGICNSVCFTFVYQGPQY